jgi:predicted glycoside hydrolase/deacetylase ChbG (UPF0249 family)
MRTDAQPTVDGAVHRGTRRQSRPDGLLIVNADDWGRTSETTDRIQECVGQGVVSSVSAMVFMEDSGRAAAMAVDRGIEAGLHVNFTTSFSGERCPTRLAEHQQALARCLRRSRFAQIIFHPGLVHSFRYVLAAQVDEFRRLYGKEPDRFDGHHHMHLCTNVLAQRLLPEGAIVRRSFSFQTGERSWPNRLYRRLVDRQLARRHRIVDFFFSLTPLEHAARWQRIVSLARQFVVEVETHPVAPTEYRFLASGELMSSAREIRILPPSAASWSAGAGA